MRSPSFSQTVFIIALASLPFAQARAADPVCSIEYDETGGGVHVDPVSTGGVQIKIPLNRHPVSSGDYSMIVDGEMAVWTFPHQFQVAPRKGRFDIFSINPSQTPVAQAENQTDGVVDRVTTKPRGTVADEEVTVANVNANGMLQLDAVDSDPGNAPVATLKSNPEAAKQATLQKQLQGLNIDRSIPESPAFTALGISPETVTRPGSPREFGTALLNGVDKDGKLQSGLAIDTAPYQVFFGADTTAEEYRNNLLTRILYNTQFSLGTTKATSDDKALRLAFGLNLTLWDNGDPRLNKEIEDLYNQDFITHRPPAFNPFQTDEQIKEAMSTYLESTAADEKALQGRLAQIRKESWAKSSWTVALAPTWITPNGNASDLKWDGATVWTSFAYGFEGNHALENKAQFILNVRYRNHETISDPSVANTLFRQDTLTVGARLRFGSPDFNASIEGAYIQTRSDAYGSGRGYRLGANLERKIAENMWLTLALGQDFNNEVSGQELFVVSGIRLGTSEKPQLTSAQ